MLGVFRFALAMAVAFSHTSLTPDFHFGAMSVAIFYLIAGYVMTHSFSANFGGKLSNIPGFYVDRFFRLYPLYIVSLLLVWGFSTGVGYGVLYTDWSSMVANLTMFQLNTHPTIMNPPAWSLGTEVQFYVLLPFLARFRSLKYALIPISYGIFVAATVGLLPIQLWSYKLLAGTLFMFLIGSVLYDMKTDQTNASRNIVIAMVAACLMQTAALSFFPALADARYSFESLAGVIIGSILLPMVAVAKMPYRGLDAWLGKLSYPIFLSHITVIYAFDWLRMEQIATFDKRGLTMLILLASVLVSIPLAYLDDYFQHIRKRLQTRTAAEPVAVTSQPTTQS